MSDIQDKKQNDIEINKLVLSQYGHGMRVNDY